MKSHLETSEVQGNGKKKQHTAVPFVSSIQAVFAVVAGFGCLDTRAVTARELTARTRVCGGDGGGRGRGGGDGTRVLPAVLRHGQVVNGDVAKVTAAYHGLDHNLTN